MRWSWGPGSLPLLLGLVQLTVPGYGNEGSRAGSCYCPKVFPSDSPPPAKVREFFRRELTDYTRCGRFVRLQGRSWSVCGGSKDPWVTELTSCFDQRGCGHAYSGRVVQQEHSTPGSIPIPKSAEGAPADTDIPAQTNQSLTLQSTQQSTLPTGREDLDEKPIHSHETTTSSVGHSLETGPEAGANQKQLEENVDPTAENPVLIPVLFVLGFFILVAVFLCVLCKRRSNQPPKYSPGTLGEASMEDQSSWQGS